MLEWPSYGAPSQDDALPSRRDFIEETEMDLPDTPAPMFAVRAFKQALFGTPAPPERPLPSQKSSKATSIKAAPSNTSDTKSGSRTDSNIDRAILSSPSKPTGILLTPGTGGTRRKTVSFRTNIPGDNKGLSRSVRGAATPRDIPGRYPSPFATTEGNIEDLAKPAKLNQPFFAAKDSTKPVSSQAFCEARTVGITLDMDAPKSESGRYWKQEYDSYAAKSILEVRKLAKKEQLAKRYARYKDMEASALREQLKQEQLKADKLEKQVAEYSTKLETATRDLDRALKKAPAEKGSSALHIGGTLRQMETENHKQTISNASLEASLRQMETKERASHEKIVQLQRENDALRKQLQSCKEIESETSITRKHVISDIWADIAAEDCLEEASSKKMVQAKRQARSPLSNREVNVEPCKSNSRADCNGIKDELASPIEPSDRSKEDRQARLEAAKKRLDEKKRNRERIRSDSRA